MSYLTSYQVFEEDPKAAIILVARYHDVLRRTPDGWKLAKRVMELLWGETKPDAGYLDGLGGRGPKVWSAMPSVPTAVTMSLEKKDLDEVVGIFKTFIKDVQEKDYGVLTHHYFIDDGDRPLIHVFEEYESSKAHLDHFANIDMQAVGRLMELVQLSEPHYYGEPSAEEQELLKGFGNVHYHRPLISIEEPASKTEPGSATRRSPGRR